MIKKGDLVEWYTESWVFKNAIHDYTNPGLVLNIEYRPFPWTRGQTDHQVAEVLWADKKISKEHISYLRKADDQ